MFRSPSGSPAKMNRRDADSALGVWSLIQRADIMRFRTRSEGISGELCRFAIDLKC